MTRKQFGSLHTAFYGIGSTGEWVVQIKSGNLIIEDHDVDVDDGNDGDVDVDVDFDGDVMMMMLVNFTLLVVRNQFVILCNLLK